MKLQKITDIRIGQVWRREYDNELCYIKRIDSERYAGMYFLNIGNVLAEQTLRRFYELVGFVNITHEVINDKFFTNKLFEIPRKELEVDDVVHFRTQKNIDIIDVIVDIKKIKGKKHYIFCQHGQYAENDIKFIIKYGVLGADYEFVNNKFNDNFVMDLKHLILNNEGINHAPANYQQNNSRV